MLADQELQNEIQDLEREVEELEKQLENSDSSTLLDTIGPVDELLHDILYDTNSSDQKYCQDDIGDGITIMRTTELRELHETELPKIQMENVYRLNGISFFPISNDPQREFLGVRFDVFREETSKFDPPHYVILKRDIIENSHKSVASSNSGNWRWSVFQTTISKGIPVFELAAKYLSQAYSGTPGSGSDKDTVEIANMNLDAVIKFAMQVYQQL